MTRMPPAVLAAVALAACGRAQPLDVRSGEWIDLTHAFGAETLYWPTAAGFQRETVAEGVSEAGYYYSAYNFAASEHGGTHIDAPVHFAEGAQSVDEIPLQSLIGPAAIIDVAAKSAADRDYQITVDDIRAWEAANGRLGHGAIVLFNTGSARFWPDARAYMGAAARGAEAVKDLHFPGIAPEAAAFLAEERDIGAVGIDTPSIDYGQSTDFMSHRILYGENIPGFENVANLDALPATGATVIALPMKIRGGSGAPLRIVAHVP